MKGFTFEIKNNLLEHKHIEAMGTAVWLFMWLDDKITKIDDEGVGWVLGGKPLVYADVKAELGIGERTYQRWVKQLAEYPYIKAIRTPRGISFRVFKAYKNFKKRSAINGGSDTTKVADHRDKSGGSNKTDTVDRDSRDTSEQSSQEIPILIKAFEEINPACKNFYKNTTQRKACQFLIDTYGFERVKTVIEKALPKTNKMKFFPTVTTPYQLQEKWASLENAIQKYRAEKLASKEKYPII